MIVIDNKTWERLSRPSGDLFVARLAFPEICNTIFCALDSKGNRHLLVLIGDDILDYADSKSRGIKIITRSLAIQGQELRRYIDLECIDESGFPIFDVIGGELASLLPSHIGNPVDIIGNVITKWRRFWDQIPSRVISREEQIGFCGEMLFLLRWLIPFYGIDVIKSWRGPWGSRHDFEWEDKSVEVKATTNSRGRIIRINSLTQLDYPESGLLYLFCVRFSEELGGTISLQKLVEECLIVFSESSECKSIFEDALVEIGYSPILSDEYDKIHFRCVEGVLFRVNDDFPKLTPECIYEHRLSGIEQVEYVVNLNTFDDLIISKDPIRMDD